MAPSVYQQRRATELAVRLPFMSRGRAKSNGRAFYLVPSQSGTTSYYTATTGDGCSCAGFRSRGICSHSVAAAMVQARQDADRTARQIPGAEMTVTPTSHRPCARKCGATLPPESRLHFCDQCWERQQRVFDGMGL